jgi:acyl-CoA thioester hydrolase
VAKLRSAMTVFQHTHRVTYAECTMGDHVYYSRYLDFLESARGEYFRQLGTSFRQWQEQDAVFPVVECRVRYRAPARYDDMLAIELWVTAVERARVNFGGRILNSSGVLLVEAETFHVCTGVDGKPRRLPETLRAALLHELAARDANRSGVLDGSR